MTVYQSPFRAVLLGFLIGSIVSLTFQRFFFSHKKTTSSRYEGYDWATDQTLEAKTIVETPFARAQMHTVRLESGSIVPDWLWFDERDAVNVIARLKDGDFIVFKQRKYGIRGTTLAPIGGMVDGGEQPLETAKRELFEETGLSSEEWTPLGTFRVAANRGAGMAHLFLCENAIRTGVTRDNPNDLESQKELHVSLHELQSGLLQGRYKEIKWSATLALALLHLQKRPDAR